MTRDSNIAIVLPLGVSADAVGAARQSLAPASVGQFPRNSAPFSALVPNGCRLRPDFIASVTEAMTDADTDTCCYTDFAVGGVDVHVGDWSAERARWQHWTGPVMVVPTAALADADPLIDAPRRSQDVRHVSRVLVDTARDDLRELTDPDRARFLPRLPYRLAGPGEAPTRELARMPDRSLVIPTRGGTGELGGRPVRWVDHCLDSLGQLLDDPGLDLVLVMDQDTGQDFLAPWAARLGDRLTILRMPGPFNFATRVNAGVSAARGEIVALLNDDTAAVRGDWLSQLTAVAMEPDVGAAGALLLYEDGSVQHRGHAFAGGGVHLIDRGGDLHDRGPRSRNACDRDVTGVTGACLVQRADVWHRMGGLDPAFPIAFNDVDYTERLRRAGLRIVLCNSAVLYHYESRSRPGDATPAAVDLLRSRWSDSLDSPDPFTPDMRGFVPSVRDRLRAKLSRWRREHAP